jgi:thiol:disulfide interchange protein DsbD
LHKISSFFITISFLLVSLGVQSQSDNVVHAKAIATLINDSSYALKISLQIDKGWHVYGENPDGIHAPLINANLESVKLLQTPKYSIAPIKQSDILFKQALVFNNDFEVNQNLQITGFQPDSLKLTLLLNAAKADQFYALELPLTVALSNGSKVAGFNILLPTTATTAPNDACGDGAVTTSSSSGWEIFLLGFLGGLIALITPCVFPMIPVTVSFFTKRSKTK